MHMPSEDSHAQHGVDINGCKSRSVPILGSTINSVIKNTFNDSAQLLFYVDTQQATTCTRIS